jgi:predicted phosphodiesterase
VKGNRINGYAFLALLGIVLFFFSCSVEETVPAYQDETGSFVVFSDLQQGYGIYSKLAYRIGQLDPSPRAAFCCGDIMLRAANEVEWLNFRRYSMPITDKMQLFIARGNHEGNDPASEAMLHEMGQIPGKNFYYSYRDLDCLFIILDTQVRGEERSVVNEQMEWLKGQLDSASAQSSVKHIFLFMHQPLYPQGAHKGSNLLNADELHSMFLQNPKVRIIFAGHDHMFNKFNKDGLLYITTGGGGGILNRGWGGDYHHFVKITFHGSPTRINIKTIGIFNEIVEDFDL